MIGNSLTYTWNVPELVAEMAARAGEPRPVIRAVTYPDFSLEDHWNGGEALELLRTGRFDVIVMQQGPSTMAASQANLLEWSRRWVDEARRVGTRSALYAVWPPKGGDLDAAIASYLNAAVATGSALLPVSHAWRLAWQDTQRPPLHGPDNFHPGPDGAWLAALVIVAMLFDRPVADFANILPERIGAESERVLRSAATAAITTHGLTIFERN